MRRSAIAFVRLIGNRTYFLYPDILKNHLKVFYHLYYSEKQVILPIVLIFNSRKSLNTCDIRPKINDRFVLFLISQLKSELDYVQ